MSSKRRLRRNICGRKKRYATQEKAVQAIRALTRAIGWQGHMAPYRCRFCNGYHFGHPPKRVRDAIWGNHV